MIVPGWNRRLDDSPDVELESEQSWVEHGVPLAVDASRNFNFVQQGLIRMITENTGIVSTVASASERYGGDGAKGLRARLYPSRIAFDASENIYISAYLAIEFVW